MAYSPEYVCTVVEAILKAPTKQQEKQILADTYVGDVNDFIQTKHPETGQSVIMSSQYVDYFSQKPPNAPSPTIK